MAFALGKPVTAYFKDARVFVRGGIHPIINALALNSAYANSYEDIVYCITLSYEKIKSIEQGNISNVYINDKVRKAKIAGNRYIKFLRKLKKPKNRMLEWLEDYYE